MWVIYALLAALMAGISITLTKAGLKKIDPVIAFAIEAILILLISWGAVWFRLRSSSWPAIDRVSWYYLIGAGVATCLSSLFQFSALKLGEASMIAPLFQLSVVFSIVFALLFLKEELNWKIILGAGLMLTGAVVISLSKKSG